jgi:hypothetical protein
MEARAAVGVALEAVVEVASSTDSSPLASAFCVNGTRLPTRPLRSCQR